MGNPQTNPSRRAFRWNLGQKTCLSAKATIGFGTNIDVSQFQNVSVVIIGAGTITANVKLAGSFLASTDANLDFTAAKSAVNPWDTIAMYDLQDASKIDGDTGVSFAGSADVRQFKVNTDSIRTLNLQVASISGSGAAVTAYIFASNNQ